MPHDPAIRTLEASIELRCRRETHGISDRRAPSGVRDVRGYVVDSVWLTTPDGAEVELLDYQAMLPSVAAAIRAIDEGDEP